MTTPNIHYTETRYGFEYGSAVVERLASDEAKGWVLIALDTPKHHVQLYVTKRGKVRIWLDGAELEAGRD